MAPHIIMMIGIPGSGKSHYAKELVKKEPDTILLSADEIRKELYGDISVQGNGNKVFGILFDRIQKAIDEGQNVILDCTNTTKRHHTISALKNMGCGEIMAIWLDTPIEVCIERNNARNDRKEPVPEDVIRKMHERLQMNPPTSGEGFNDIIVIRDWKG